MKVLVTGATGFVGAQICHVLLQRGHEVRATYRRADYTGRIDALAAGAERRTLNLGEATEAQLDELTSGMDACIHSAWYTEPGKYLTSLENIECLNMTTRLIQAATRNDVKKMVGIGSCFEYDVSAGLISERTPLQPTTLYAASKIAAYFIGQQLARTAGMSFAWCRLFYLYGPFETPRRLVSDLAMNLLNGQSVAVTHGRQIRDFLHIRDAAAGIVAVAESQLAEPVNVGSGNPVTVREVVQTLAELTGRGDLIQYGARPENLLDPPKVLADIELLKKHTNWTPAYNLTDGLRDSVNWWKENKL